MKRYFLVIPVILLLVIGIILTSCASSPTSPTTSAAPATTPSVSAAPQPSTSASTTSAAANPPQAVIKLKFSTDESSSSPGVKGMYDAWMDKIEKDTGGRVKFERYYGGSLISQNDAWKELLAGSTDAINLHTQTSPGPSIMPIQNASSTFFYGVKDHKTMNEIYTKILKEFPEFSKEFDGAKVISYGGKGTMNIHADKPLKTLADFKGKKLRTVGAWFSYTFQKLGAEPVNMGPAEMYTSVQKGLVNGCATGNSALENFRLAEVLKYTINIRVGDSCMDRTLMNWNSYKKLPADIQKIIDDSYTWAIDQYRVTAENNNKSGADFANKLGHDWIDLSKADMDTFYGYLAEEAMDKVKALDSKGLPGTKIFQRTRQLIDEANK